MRIPITVVAIILCFSVQSQSIIGAKYWFNSQSNTITTGSLNTNTDGTIGMNANTSNLPNGFHSIGIMYQQNNGKFSSPITSNFFKASCAGTSTSCKYWYDNETTATEIPLASTNDDITFNLSVANNINPGFHALHTQFKNNSCLWSAAVSTIFYHVKCAGASEGFQYWFDSDTANRKFSTSTNYENIAITPQNLVHGYHTLNIRFRQGSCLWSSTLSEQFYYVKGNGIAEYEYWFDDNYANKTKESLTTNGANYVMPIIKTESDKLKNGFHQIHLRYKPNGGLWSSVQSEMFFKRGKDVFQLMDVVECRYWFNGDETKQKNIKTRLITGKEIIQKVDVEELPLGRNYVSMQFKDNGNVWSSIIEDSFTRVNIISKEFLYPHITLNKTTAGVNEVLEIRGSKFVPNGEINLLLRNLTSKILEKDTLIDADENGTFTLNLRFNSNSFTGLRAIETYDVTNERRSYTATFILNAAPINNLNGIIVLSPTLNQVVKAKTPISIQWSDNNIMNVANNNLYGNTAQKSYQYRIEYSLNDSPYQFCPDFGKYKNGKIEGNFLVFQDPVNYLKINFEPQLPGTYKFRIRDLIDQKVGYSNELIVEANLNEYIVDFDFDKSAPIPINTKLLGVCADGTARILIKIIQPSTNNNPISEIKLELFDNTTNKTPTHLGKIIKAEKPFNYTYESINASQIIASANSTVDLAKKVFYFWYIAPDDFDYNVEFSNSGLIAKRIVKFKVDIIYSSTQSSISFESPKKIEIVRPPLMLVHGLAGSASTWDNFDYEPIPNLLGVGLLAKNRKFKESNDIFLAGIHINDMNPSSCFIINAKKLLNLNSDNCNENEILPIAQPLKNSFANAINTARKNGYACNRIDYVCHSMGGVMARTAINMFSKYYNPDLYSTSEFKNYNNGFINKFISINTPHNGSPFANLCIELCNQTKAGDLKTLQNFIDLTKDENSMFNSFIKPANIGFDPTGAIENMQYYGSSSSITFKETKVKNHLIGGLVENQFLLREGSNVANLYRFNLGKYLKIIKNHSLYNNSMLFYDMANTILSRYSIPDFLNNSDLVVPVISQVPDSVNRSKNSFKIFKGLNARHTGSMEKWFLTDKEEESVVSNFNVGNHVFNVLNKSINSDYFENKIAANPFSGGTLYKKQPVSFSLNSSADSLKYNFDKNKISFTDSSILTLNKIDSSVNLKFIVADTSKLKGVKLYYQGELYFSNSKVNSQTITVQNSVDFPGKNIAYVSAEYDSVGFINVYTDSINIFNNISDTLKGIFLSTNRFFINKNESFKINALAVYPRNIVNIAISDSSLNIVVADTNIMRYNKSSNEVLVLEDTGSTYIIVEYKGFKDTLYVFINKLDEDYIPLCPQASKLLISNISGANYQWQVNDGSGFKNLSNSYYYRNVTTDSLLVVTPPGNFRGYKYRCKVNFPLETYSTITTISYAVEWTGQSDSLWTNSNNWVCGQIPDQYTDVVIPSSKPNYPTVPSNITINSLKLENGSIVNLKAGVVITVKSKE